MARRHTLEQVIAPVLQGREMLNEGRHTWLRSSRNLR